MLALFSPQFLQHILISGIIFAILASGFKFFVKLTWTLDFSYLAIVIFWAYVSSLINTVWGRGILASILAAFLSSIVFTFLILFLSSKLSDAYFSIGTFALYILTYQVAFNRESVTGGALGMSWMGRNIITTRWEAWSLSAFLTFAAIIGFAVFAFLLYFKKTYFYTILQWWWENDVVITSLGVRINLYKFVMIAMTTFLAVVGGALFSFYYSYIDPPSFWLSMLVLLLVIVFLSYSLNDVGTFFVAVLVMFCYEYLRFFKIVDPAKIGYFREIIFGILIILVSFWVFRKITFERAH